MTTYFKFNLYSSLLINQNVILFSFISSEIDEVSMELHNVAQTTMCGILVGAGLGGFAKSRDAYLTFIESNQATIFKSTLEAKVFVVFLKIKISYMLFKI